MPYSNLELIDSNKMAISKKGLPPLELTSICIFGIFYIDFEIQGRYQIIFPFIALIYLVYCYFREPSKGKLLIRFILACTIVALLYQFMTVPVTVSGSNAGFKYFYSNFTQYLLAFFPLALLYRTNKLATQKQKAIIIGVILFTGILLIQTALKIAEKNPDILHSMNQEILDDAGVTLQGFDFVYAFTFLIITCFIVLKNQSSALVKYISIAFLIYFIYFLLKAQFALAFVTTFISCLYLYYTTTKNISSRLLTIIGLCAIAYLLPYFLEWLIDVTRDSQVLNVRLREIYDSLTGNHSENSDMQARFDLYWNCIMAFLDSPIFGNKYLPFNGHSTFLLAFAYLGIFGGTFVCYIFYRASKFVESVIGIQRYKYFRPLMCQIILMGLTNPILSVPSNFIMLFFVCPLLICQFVKE